MKLVASLIVRNEVGRYLEPCIGHLLEFVDAVAVLDDGSDDGFPQALIGAWGDAGSRVVCRRNERPKFFEHEGWARQELLEFTLSLAPTHVLAIDADEFVTDGAAIRRACSRGGDVWTLEMLEVWKAFDGCLCIRQDGGWRPHRAPVLFRVPSPLPATFRIRDSALACGREPESVRRSIQRRRAAPAGSDILHFGWANELERRIRHDRYVVADGGRFHQATHLDSIIWPDERVEMESYEWPAALEPWRPSIVDRGGR